LVYAGKNERIEECKEKVLARHECNHRIPESFKEGTLGSVVQKEGMRNRNIHLGIGGRRSPEK